MKIPKGLKVSALPPFLDMVQEAQDHGACDTSLRQLRRLERALAGGGTDIQGIWIPE